MKLGSVVVVPGPVVAYGRITYMNIRYANVTVEDGTEYTYLISNLIEICGQAKKDFLSSRCPPQTP
jgi:hypothetical protein